MTEYRKTLYPQYFTTFYSIKNTTTPESLFEVIDLDYHDLIPKDKGARILDVGCGTGHFLHYLKRQGYEKIEGVEQSPEQADLCERSGLSVTRTEDLFALLGERASTYDFIVLNDVLEHFTKDEAIVVLGLLKGALVPGGRLVLRVPNMSCIYGLHGRYIDFTHEIGFTEFSMTQVLSAVGFKDIAIRDNRTPFGLKPLRLCRWILYKLWHKLLSFIYLIEVGTDRPRLLGKVLIASAARPSD